MVPKPLAGVSRWGVGLGTCVNDQASIGVSGRPSISPNRLWIHVELETKTKDKESEAGCSLSPRGDRSASGRLGKAR